MKNIKPENYKVGKKYKYSEIPKEDTEKYVVSDYGIEYTGQNAIHIRFFENEIDVWFIYDGYTSEGSFKCVYHG